MNKFWMTGLGAMAFAAAFGQAATSLYAPVRLIKDQGISLKSWGAGTASETDELAYEGGHSIRISTRNSFSGGLILYSTPVALADEFGDKNNLLRLTYRSAENTVLNGGRPGGTGPGAGAPGSNGPGGKGGGGVAGGGGGAAGGPGTGEFGGGGRGQGTSGANSAPQKLETIRLIVTTTDGKNSEAYIPVSTNGSGDKGWRTAAIPLQSIRGFDRTNKEVKQIALSGDITTTFYVGDMRVVNDTTPITGDVNVRELNLALGDFVNLGANGYGGSSILKYSWDFDDKDGIQEDAAGQFIRHQFRKPGTYTITLTVSDEFGLKKPYSTTIKAKVNP
ncbi:MAG TPA: PKD domain-containing protein [Fimbriimonadaceae bacterium]|nr:PKD domain-containing protein [Fimbriimonadaceae bacterium]